jgi:hypothetical protein
MISFRRSKITKAFRVGRKNQPAEQIYQWPRNVKNASSGFNNSHTQPATASAKTIFPTIFNFM